MIPFHKTQTNALSFFSVYILIKLFLSLLTLRIRFPEKIWGRYSVKISPRLVTMLITLAILL